MPQEDQRGVLDMDLHNLELDWVRQPGLTEEYLTYLADAQEVVDDLKLEIEKAKERRKTVDAMLDMQFRKANKDWKEKGFESAVQLHPDHAEAMQKIFDLQHNLNTATAKASRIDAVVHALVDKKKALEKNVDMMLAGLWAPCRQPQGQVKREELEEMQKKQAYDKARPRNRGAS